VKGEQETDANRERQISIVPVYQLEQSKLDQIAAMKEKEEGNAKWRNSESEGKSFIK